MFDTWFFWFRFEDLNFEVQAFDNLKVEEVLDKISQGKQHFKSFDTTSNNPLNTDTVSVTVSIILQNNTWFMSDTL